MAATAILNFLNIHFRRHRYVPNRSPNVSTNVGDDRSNNKEMAAVFRIHGCSDRHLEFSKLCIYDVIDMIQIKVSMFS